MRFSSLGRLLFVFYCVEAGSFLLLAPWSMVWDRTLAEISLGAFYSFLAHPAARGAVSGFGLVHLVWAAHDLDLWLKLRIEARKSA
ncbi:MAG: hypothetical protein OES47_10310 [Acidobacteriota bacterium]|nr:hypothetical protein [Acidobacteriota bacterium]